jgi:hypothetical protein
MDMDEVKEIERMREEMMTDVWIKPMQFIKNFYDMSKKFPKFRDFIVSEIAIGLSGMMRFSASDNFGEDYDREFVADVIRKSLVYIEEGMNKDGRD